MTRPLVGIVVVNFHGDDRTVQCVEALTRSAWPADRLEIVVVDNGSSPSFPEQVRRPGVRHLRAGGNVGFPAACNLGIDQLKTHCDFVGLLNNDAVPAIDWLEPLVEALTEDPGLGGVNPRILLAGLFVRLTFRTTTRRAGGGDLRQLGVQLSGVRVDGRDVDPELGTGFWGWEQDESTGRFSWTSGHAIALLPLGAPSTSVGSVEVRLSSVLGPTWVEVDAGAGVVQVHAQEHPAWVTVGENVKSVRLVNSTGVELRSDATCADRDYQALDSEVSEAAPGIFACSGAAALFRSAFLTDVGPMDEQFFLYYEDVDLCWRGRLRGWRFGYVASSIVTHEHSATVGSGSRLATHLASRNRLLTLTKVAPLGVAVSAFLLLVGDLLRGITNDVLRNAIRARKPETEHVARMLRVLAGFVRLLPRALRARRLLSRTATVDRRRAMLEN